MFCDRNQIGISDLMGCINKCDFELGSTCTSERKKNRMFQCYGSRPTRTGSLKGGILYQYWLKACPSTKPMFYSSKSRVSVSVSWELNKRWLHNQIKFLNHAVDIMKMEDL
jgi:hypothetical protein